MSRTLALSSNIATSILRGILRDVSQELFEPYPGCEYTFLLLFKLYHTCMVPGNHAVSPFDNLAAPAISDRGGDPMDPQGQPKFVQITTTVAPLSPTLLYALDT